jgi:branched-chain amino acid transport system permease protein
LVKHSIDGPNRNRKKAAIYTVVCATLLILILLPFWLKSRYLIHLAIMSCVNIILGLSFSLLFSTGLITLGAAAPFGIGAYASATLVTKFAIPFWLALPFSIAITGVISLALGCVFCRTAGAPFVILTMLSGLVVSQVAGQIEFFGGWGGMINIPRPDPIGPIEFVGKEPYYYMILTLLLLIGLTLHALYTSRYGRVWRAIKLSPHLAETLGINLYHYRVLAFLIAAVISGTAGCFYAHYARALVPDTFGGWSSILIQLYAVLGGLEFPILGPAIGAVVMTFVPEMLRIAKEVEPIITGVLLLIIILFFPGGLLGTMKGLFRLASAEARSGQTEDRAFASRKPARADSNFPNDDSQRVSTERVFKINL